jgi:hypothetical protein
VVEQTVPQAPQWLVLVVVVTSQPLTPLPSQLARPALHTGRQTPPEHEVLLAPVVEQTVPQAPQWLVLVVVVTSQPLAPLPSQLARPALHTGSPRARGAARARGRADRAAGAAVTGVGRRSHLATVDAVAVAVGATRADTGTHTPEEHEVLLAPVVEQTVPQAPQWLVLVVVVTSQPLAPLPSQLARPALHTGTHTPEEHEVLLAPVVEQTVPHAPQLLVSVESARQMPPQLLCPDVQPHTPAVHTPPEGEVQLVPLLALVQAVGPDTVVGALHTWQPAAVVSPLLWQTPPIRQKPSSTRPLQLSSMLLQISAVGST